MNISPINLQTLTRSNPVFGQKNSSDKLIKSQKQDEDRFEFVDCPCSSYYTCDSDEDYPSESLGLTKDEQDEVKARVRMELLCGKIYGEEAEFPIDEIIAIHEGTRALDKWIESREPIPNAKFRNIGLKTNSVTAGHFANQTNIIDIDKEKVRANLEAKLYTAEPKKVYGLLERLLENHPEIFSELSDSDFEAISTYMLDRYGNVSYGALSSKDKTERISAIFLYLFEKNPKVIAEFLAEEKTAQSLGDKSSSIKALWASFIERFKD